MDNLIQELINMTSSIKTLGEKIDSLGNIINNSNTN